MTERVSSTKEHETRPQRRLVVTGIGAITPLGITASKSWESALEGKTVASLLPFDERFEARVATQIDYHPEEHFSGEELRVFTQRTHRSVQFSTIAVREALRDAGLLDTSGKLIPSMDPWRIGTRIGSGVGGGDHYVDVGQTIRDRGPNRVSAMSILKILPERVSSVPSMEFNLKAWPGVNVMACATGAANIADSGILIQANKADIFVCGGAEAALSESMVAGFGNMRALSTSFNDSPTLSSRPFDKGRDGFVPGEGSVVLVLEESEHALRRDAHIYAELAGMFSSADAKDPVQPDPETISKSIEFALIDAGIDKGSVDLIVAHATSTPIGDVKEIEALRKVFNGLLPNIPITAPKSMFGHLLGAAGSLNAMIAVKAIETGKIPPTVNLDNPEEEFLDLNFVSNAYQERQVNVAIVNSFGFGGLNTVLIFRRFLPS